MTNQSMPFAAIPVEAARLSGLTRTEIYNLLNAGKQRAHQSGRRTLMLMEDVVKHIQSLPHKKFGVGSGLRKPNARSQDDH